MSDKFTEIRRGKLIVNQTGRGNSASMKLIIPKAWCEKLGLSPLDRDIKLIFENEKRIIIEKF